MKMEVKDNKIVVEIEDGDVNKIEERVVSYIISKVTDEVRTEIKNQIMADENYIKAIKVQVMKYIEGAKISQIDLF